MAGCGWIGLWIEIQGRDRDQSISWHWLAVTAARIHSAWISLIVKFTDREIHSPYDFTLCACSHIVRLHSLCVFTLCATTLRVNFTVRTPALRVRFTDGACSLRVRFTVRAFDSLSHSLIVRFTVRAIDCTARPAPAV